MIADRIRQARLAAGLTLDAVAERLARAGHPITRAGLSKYETANSMPGPKLLLKLANVLQRRPAYFLREAATVRIEWLRPTASRLRKARLEEIDAAVKNTVEGQLWLQATLCPNCKSLLPERRSLRSVSDVEASAASL